MLGAQSTTEDYIRAERCPTVKSKSVPVTMFRPTFVRRCLLVDRGLDPETGRGALCYWRDTDARMAMSGPGYIAQCWSAGLVVTRSRVRSSARTAVECSCPELTFRADSFFRYPFHPRRIAAAHSLPRSFCQKCRWQVTARLFACALDSTKSEWAD